MRFLEKTYSIFIVGIGFINSAMAIPSVIKIEDAHYLNQKEIKYFPEKIPNGCTPVSVLMYINEEMTKAIKSEYGFTQDAFFKKESTGNKISFIFFPNNCSMKKSINSTSAVFKIRKEIENWLPFHTPKKTLENK